MSLEAGEIILNDNQATSTNLFIFNIKDFKGVQIDYTVLRGDLVEQGNIELSYNRLINTAKITTVADFDETGVLFCAIVSGNHVRLLYTCTATGIKPIFKYSTTYFPL